MGLGRWVKEQNDQGRMLSLGRFVRWLISWREFHSSKRISNKLTVALNRIFSGWKPLELESQVLNRVFSVYESSSSSGKSVHKIPPGDNEFSHRLIERLSDAAELARYEETLRQLSGSSGFPRNTPKIFSIRPDGGYESEYVEGSNLLLLRERLISFGVAPGVDHERLAEAIRTLKSVIIDYCDKHDRLIGDWALHNLVYHSETNTIFNVDLEGFYSYSGSSIENNPDFVVSILDDLLQLLDLCATPDRSRDVMEALKLLQKVREGDSSYNGSMYIAGYHSIEIRDLYFRGQRECRERLSSVPFDFVGKRVLDLGCNTGGMLHAVAQDIDEGVGLDYDQQAIAAAAFVSGLNQSRNLHFHVADFNKDLADKQVLRNILQGRKADIVFLLSVCMWVDDWKGLIRQAYNNSSAMLFETNGTVEEQRQQVEVLEELYGDVLEVNERATDDLFQQSRSLYLCGV